MSTTAIKKLEALNKKISSLKQDKLKVQNELAKEFIEVVKQTEALTVDFPSLIGGLLEIVKTIQSEKPEKEVWHKAGRKFLRSLANADKPQKTPGKVSQASKESQ